MNKPSISVVMPLYNKELEVGRAIHSVLAQSFSDFELIIVNDGSTDRSVEEVNCFADARIRLVNQNNQGVSAARNRGVAESRSDLVAFLDADDEWGTEFFWNIINLRFHYPQCDVFATGYLYKKKSGVTHAPVINGLGSEFVEGELDKYFVIAAISDPPLWTSAICVTKTAFNEVGGFPLGVTLGEDLLTWARLAAKYRIAYSENPHSYFCEPDDLCARMQRMPATPDVVGEELERLMSMASEKHLAGIRSYVAFWYKMRASIFLHKGMGEDARREIRKARFHGDVSLKNMFMFLLSYFPGRMIVVTISIVDLIRK